ncbi:hypothetical protein ABGT24_19975 [Peribacillus frigoritolerans]|uniref:hypothetical protein n=1 Tax=Peribacillus frigoritolerans TaxID=450367 RepID=UPI00345DF98F
MKFKKIPRVELVWAGKVYWKDTFEARKYQMLEEDLSCDVCIEGSGSQGHTVPIF